MADLRQKIAELYALEGLAAGKTCVHRLHPLAKLLATLAYLVSVVSLDRYEPSALAAFALYPVLLAALAEVSFRMIVKRALVALPFCLLAGVSNLFFEPAVWQTVGPVSITYGMLSCAVLLLRTLLCAAAVLVLVAVTPLAEIAGALRRVGVPQIFIALLEMTYRYGGILAEEATAIYTAYHLRSRTQNGVALAHMGLLLGQLLLRSFDRAERVYQAMQCRGYGTEWHGRFAQPFSARDMLFLLLVGGSCLWFRFVPWTSLWGRWLAC